MQTNSHEQFCQGPSWFDSPYYPILYKKRSSEEARAFIDKLIAVLKPGKDARILDLCCGRGRHSIYLNSLGFDVTGIDSSEGSIACSKKSEHEHLRFFVHDMRKVFRKEYFHFVLNLFTSFGYFDEEKEDLRSLDAVWQDLLPGGIFVLDFLNMDKTIRKLVPSEVKTIDQIEFHIKRSIVNNFLVKDITFEDKNEKYHFTEKVKILKKEDFENYFMKSGFAVIRSFGDYDLNPFDRENSGRLIWVTQKKSA